MSFFSLKPITNRVQGCRQQLGELVLQEADSVVAHPLLGSWCREAREVSWEISKSYQATNYVESPGAILGSALQSVNVNQSERQ